MIVVFLIFAAILIWFSWKSLVGGVRYLEFFKEKLTMPEPAWAPFATVICPCRGVDQGMEENLAALLRQHFPSYEVIFAVDDENDPAKALIEKAVGQARLSDIKIVVALRAVGCAQKLENLREAVSHADSRSKVLVFVDSDTRVSAHWLKYLVAAVEPNFVGAATGYRWFISDRPSFASEMCSVWNASIASALGPNTRSNFCWGGSTAIRRDIFDRLGIREKWATALSDDFVLTRAVREADLEVVHVPQALTATVENCTLRQLIEFTTRQMKITRVYMPELWLMSLFGSAVFCGVILSACLIAILSRENTFAVVAALITILLVTVFSTGKSWMRLNAVRLAMPQYDRELRRQFVPQNTLWLLSPLLFLYNSIAALFSRTIVWRGTRYELKSPTETVIIRSE